MLEGLFFILVSIITLCFQPFTGSLLIPSIVRILILALLVFCFIIFSIKKKTVFYFVCVFIPVGAFLSFIWYRNSPKSLPHIFYFLAFVALAVGWLETIKKMPRLAYLISRFLLFSVVLLSVQAIVSFITFNLDLLPFKEVQIGDFDFYKYFYNPILGYIDPRKYENGVLGRPAGFMFEPSYLAWYLTTNFFLIGKYMRVKGAPVVICKSIVLLGALCTASVGAIFVFAVMFLFGAVQWGMQRLRSGQRLVNIVTWILTIGIPLAFLLAPKEQISNAMGRSSLGAREERMQASLLILAASGVPDLLLGHSPGYVENLEEGQGESNQYMKLVVEQGIVLTLVIVWFIIFCTRKSRHFMLANLIFLNSVVILWTPLFLINILICKWQDEKSDPKAYV